VAHSAQASPALDESVGKGAKDTLASALSHQQTDVVKEGEWLVAASPLPAFEDGKRALLVAAAPASLIQDPSELTMVPILGALALGLILVAIAGWLLGNYITRPINTLEEGLLAILNGQTDKRFELDHAELGGLAFRIDQLLNQLMGVEEDTTDAEGRVSMAPNAANFTDALAVDDKRMTQQAGEGTMDPESIRRLASEASGQYYGRIYREYIAAKKAIGEATDHIAEQAFAARIQAMEQEAAQKYGRPVRYQVQQRAKEVVLLAVPLP
jgi:methyl-accepting chemotaxis protein